MHHTYTEQAIQTVRMALERSAPRLSTEDISAELTADRLSDGRMEIGLHFRRGADFLDAAFALVNESGDPSIDVVQGWAEGAIADAVDLSRRD